MDPDCAICRAPASVACDCEAKGLEAAIRHAETRMMQSIYQDIRAWVRAHAQDYILEYFKLLTDRRKATHHQQIDRLTASAYHYFHQPPHPNEIAQAQAQLKRGIDDDWKASVARYPEVLEYFFSLVDLNLPSDEDAAVKEPPLAAAAPPPRKNHRRLSSVPHDAYSERDRPLQLPSRTPPPVERRSSRMTPGPIMSNPMGPPPSQRPRTAFRPPPAIPPPGYGYYQ